MLNIDRIDDDHNNKNNNGIHEEEMYHNILVDVDTSIKCLGEIGDSFKA